MELTQDNKKGLLQHGVIRCYTTESDAQSRMQFPYRGSIDAFEQWLAPKVEEYNRQHKTNSANRAGIITIPVVFHIITSGSGATNVSAAIIQAQINQLNIDFRNLAGSTNPVAADTEVEFCLATLDPSNNVMAEPGINRVTTYGAGAFTNTYINSTIKPATSWDPNSYMNIWSANISGGLLGWAQFPDSSGLAGMPGSGGGANTDGVVALHTSLGSVANPNPAGGVYAQGRTMTHEVGHWLGLRHIWGDGGCAVDDFCNDTPLSSAANFGCPNINSCIDPAPDPKDMVENYMDYTNDACMNIFTANQKARIQTVLSLSPRRVSLASSTKCGTPVPTVGFSTGSGGTKTEATNCSYQDYTVAVTISMAPSAAATVTFNTTGLTTATVGQDFDFFPASVVFPAGSTASQTVTIRIYNDGVVEPTEVVELGFTIATSGNAVAITGNLATYDITILDDDIAPASSGLVTILSQDFESGLGTWTTQGNTGSNRFLVGNTLAATSTYWTTSGNTTQFAYSNDDACNCNKGNDRLISPVFSLVGSYTAATLTFDHAYSNLSEVGTVQVSTNGGTNYSTLATLTNTSTGQPGQVTTPWVNGVTINMTPYIGQSNLRIRFVYNDNTGWQYGMCIDNVVIKADAPANIQTIVNTALPRTVPIKQNQTIHLYDPTSGNVMGTIQNNQAFNYGCTAAEVDRSQASVGNPTIAFIDTTSSSAMLSKTFKITPSSDTATGNYTVSLYYKLTEVTAWEAATGKSRNALQLIKVIDNPIGIINDTNFQSYTIQEIPVTISYFGADVIFSANFTSKLSGGYAVGPKTGLICGDITTIWNGTTWSDGNPSKIKAVSISGNYNTASYGSFECCSLTVSSGNTLDINANTYVNVINNLTVNGQLRVLNNGSLVQVNNSGVNVGVISYERIASVKLSDYVYWSTPVAGFNINAISPLTPSSLFWTWNPTIVNTNTGQGNWVNASSVMSPGVGYIVRAPNGFNNTTNQNWTVTFNNGVPNNGIYTPTISRGSNLNSGTTAPNGVVLSDTDDNWNLLGNPYPSAISIDSFLEGNSNVDGFVRLWTHGTLPVSNTVPFYGNFSSNYTAGDYIALNGAGATSGPGTLNVIGGGQGFFVLMNPGSAGSSTVTFNNGMRDKGYSNSQFYRTTNDNTQVDKNRIWLDLVGPSETTRTLLAYVANATNGRDRLYDALTDYKSNQNFYSIIEETPMTIQGRVLPFEVNDVVIMGIKVPIAGTYAIAIGALDGLFDTQDIFLRDNHTNGIHNLKNTPYTFTAASGIINNRFEIIYQNSSLGNHDLNNDNSVVIFGHNQILTVHSTKELIKEIRVYDVLGRSIYTNQKVNSNRFNTNLRLKNQTLIVKVRLDDGQLLTKIIVW